MRELLERVAGYFFAACIVAVIAFLMPPGCSRHQHAYVSAYCRAFYQALHDGAHPDQSALDHAAAMCGRR